MHVYRSLLSIPPEAKNAVVSIGNFDGVHQGHRRVFRRNLEIARHIGAIPSVLTFDPHPTRVVAPERAPRLLTTVDQRLALMADCGIEQAFVLPFDQEFSRLDPESFVRQVLAEGIGARAVLVGDNFRFGAKQAGDIHTLSALGQRFGFSTETLPIHEVRGRIASSTAVRDLVTAGDVSAACRLLGRPFSLEGRVVSGHGIGSKQTVPTLNLQTSAEVLPATGVYITRTADTGGTKQQWPSITNVGFRPTFDGNALTVETYLLSEIGGAGPPRGIRVDFLRRVREERKFESPQQLREQILRDVSRANAWFRRLELFQGHRSTRVLG